MKFTKEQQAMCDSLTKLQRAVALEKIKNPGRPDSDCYVLGGGKAATPTSVRTSASEIMTNPNVVAFIESFNSEVEKDTILSREEVLEDLTNLSRSHVGQILKWHQGCDNDGAETLILSIKSMEELCDADMKLIKSVKMGKYGVEVQLHDPMAARKLICEMQGFLAPIKTEGVNVTKELSNEEYDRFLGELGV